MSSLRVVRVVMMGLMLGIAMPSAPAWSQPPQESAVELAEKGKKAYEKGDYLAAIDLYDQARTRSSDPVLLRNLGRCYEAQGRVEKDRDAAIERFEFAINLYKEYSDKAPEARPLALRWIAELNALVEKLREPPPAQPAPTTTTTRPPDTKPPSPSAVPWVLTGAGALIIGAGAVLGAVAKDAHDQASNEGQSGKDAFEKQSKAEKLAVGANVAFAVGGVAMAIGVPWGIADLISTSKKAQTPKASSSLVVTGYPGGIMASGRF